MLYLSIRFQRDAEAYVGKQTDDELIDMYRLDKEGIDHVLQLVQNHPALSLGRRQDFPRFCNY